MSTYIALVNKLRNRFNEVALNASTTWSTVVGWDLYTKEAINYAYHDILNAEMEWPFLHQQFTQATTPGIQLYTPSLTAPAGFTSPAELKEIDWDSFYIDSNNTNTTISNETVTIPSTSPYVITTANDATWNSDLGVTHTIGGIAFTPVSGDPATSQYTITNGRYYFASGDAGVSVKISYITSKAPTTASVITPSKLIYMDYDHWREAKISQDKGVIKSGESKPMSVFRTQKHGEFGLTPIPDKYYNIIFEYWLDGLDMSAAADTSLIPTRFEQVIIDGASMYCYNFREDQQLATAMEKKFNSGIARMRTELINREVSMDAGFYWYPHGFSYTMNTTR